MQGPARQDECKSDSKVSFKEENCSRQSELQQRSGKVILDISCGLTENTFLAGSHQSQLPTSGNGEGSHQPKFCAIFQGSFESKPFKGRLCSRQSQLCSKTAPTASNKYLQCTRQSSIYQAQRPKHVLRTVHRSWKKAGFCGQD